MFKRTFSIFIFLVFLFNTSSITLLANTPEASISENKVKFQQMNDKTLELNSEISSLNIEMNKLKNLIEKNDANILENEKQVKSLENQNNQLSIEIDTSYTLAGKRFRAMYMTGSNKSYVATLLTSENLSDLFLKLDAIIRIATFDRKLLNELEGKQKSLKESISELEVKKQELQLLKSSNTDSLQQLTSKKIDLENLVKKFEEEKQAAALVIKENEEKLLSHSLLVINSPASTISDIKNAISTLRSLIPQLNTDSIKKKAQDYINAGNKKLTLMAINPSNPNRGGDTNNDTYKATYSMVATAYTGHAMTSMGLVPVRDPNGLSTIAVDPSVIPLGTKVYIPNYGYAICADTGGAIKGNIIDLFLDSTAECFAWGRRGVTLHVIAYPGEW